MRRQLAAFGLILAVILAWNHFRTQAQTGSVQFLGAASGTTLSANCPATPSTPSICVVGGGVYIYQSTTTGWFLPQPASTSAGVLKVNGVSPGSTGNVTVGCTTPQTTVTASTPVATAPPLSISSSDLAVGPPTVSAPTVVVPSMTGTCTGTGS